MALIALCPGCDSSRQGGAAEQTAAPAPPMGWNSWICFGASVTEDEVKANADYMAANLKEYGWEYIVVDGGWYAPGMVTVGQYEDPHPHQLIDEYGRLIPDPEKFPNGFKPLADYIHSLGLKFGIHIMRGIPIQAVEQNTPILGSECKAQDICMKDASCDWYFGLYGVDMSRPGAQEYYNSIFELYQSWGVDYVKADDLTGPVVYACDEIEAIAKANARLDKPVVLSLSPGPAPLQNIKHLRESATLWRVSEDFWDNWESLKAQFALCAKWAPYVTDGGYPDADMLPIGPMAQRAMRGQPRNTNFTVDEQYTLLTLWAMARSPLMIGCNLPELDPFTLSLLTNKEIIAIDQNSTLNRQWFEKEGVYGWFAADKDGKADYVALFNTTDAPVENYPVDLGGLQRGDYQTATELWSGAESGVDKNSLTASVRPHGAVVFKLTK